MGNYDSLRVHRKVVIRALPVDKNPRRFKPSYPHTFLKVPRRFSRTWWRLGGYKDWYATTGNSEHNRTSDTLVVSWLDKSELPGWVSREEAFFWTEVIEDKLYRVHWTDSWLTEVDLSDAHLLHIYKQVWEVVFPEWNLGRGGESGMKIPHKAAPKPSLFGCDFTLIYVLYVLYMYVICSILPFSPKNQIS